MLDSREVLTTQPSFVDALFTALPLGVAICNRRLRFEMVNDSLAAMNGLPVAAHVGKTLYSVLGAAAAKIQPLFEQVFSTGEPVCGVYVTAQLPTRQEPGHWLETYIPIKDRNGAVQQVGAIVLEITATMRVEAELKRLRKTLFHAETVLDQVAQSCASALLRRSISDACKIAESLFWSTIAVAASNPCPAPQNSGQQIGPPTALSGNGHGLPLSVREREVLCLLAQGKANKEIASALGLSVRTVETYRARLMLKLGLHSVPQLVRYAIRNKLI